MKNLLLLVFVLAVIVAGGIYWYASRMASVSGVAHGQPEKLTPSAPAEQGMLQAQGSGAALFDLKSSIQDVIEDSVQEEIQHAVEDKIKETEENQ